MKNATKILISLSILVLVFSTLALTTTFFGLKSAKLKEINPITASLQQTYGFSLFSLIFFAFWISLSIIPTLTYAKLSNYIKKEFIEDLKFYKIMDSIVFLSCVGLSMLLVYVTGKDAIQDVLLYLKVSG